MEENTKFVTFIQNPEIDILLGYVGITIPSKRVDFKPIEVMAIYHDGKEEILNDFYVKSQGHNQILKRVTRESKDDNVQGSLKNSN
jgi:hypothetical protein